MINEIKVAQALKVNTLRVPEMTFGPSQRGKSRARDAMHDPCNSSWGEL